MRRATVVVPLVLASLGCGNGHESSRAPSPDRSSAFSAAAYRPARAVLARDPYMGVACRTPNSIECDRVGLAVWVRRPALRVSAAIAGRQLELDDPDWSGMARFHGQRKMFAGFLQPAGLIDGPLRVSHGPVSARVRLLIRALDGTAVWTQVKVGLAPGWG